MERRFILWKLLIRNSNDGITMVELLISMFIASIVVGLAFTVMLFDRKLYAQDQVRTTVNQNLRSAMDMIGPDIKQAGERLPANFPAIELNTVSGQQVLTIRRSLSSTALPVCQPTTGTAPALTAGSNTQVIVVSYYISAALGPNQNCKVVGASTTQLNWPGNLIEWQNIRCGPTAAPGCIGKATAYIYNSAPLPAGTPPYGESFYYDNEGYLQAPTSAITTPTAAPPLAYGYAIHKATATPTWQKNYDSSLNNGCPSDSVNLNTNCFVYLMEERQYTLIPDPSNAGKYILQLTINPSTDNLQYKLVNNMSKLNFQVWVKNVATSQTTFNNPTDQWRNIKSIQVSLTAIDPSAPVPSPSPNYVGVRDDYLVLTSKFYPRNALSQ